MVLVLGVLLCVIYPAIVTVLGNLLFSEKAKGGIISLNGKAIGAQLISQGFTKPQYFQGRLSAAGDKGFDAANSTGSNLGPTSKKLMDRMKVDIDRIKKENPTLKEGAIPAELVTASGSGLDPHLSPEATGVQADRVAQARGVAVEEIKKLIKKITEGPSLGFLGESTVNILLLNLELDRLFPVK